MDDEPSIPSPLPNRSPRNRHSWDAAEAKKKGQRWGCLLCSRVIQEQVFYLAEGLKCSI